MVSPALLKLDYSEKREAPYFDLQTSSVSGPKRNLHSCSFAPQQIIKPRSPPSFPVLYDNDCKSRCLFTSSLADTERERETERHRATPFQSTDLIPGTRASSADNNHSCVGWESAANQSAAADMTWRHPTAPSSGIHAQNQEAADLKWKWKQRTASNGSKNICKATSYCNESPRAIMKWQK